MSRMSLSVPVLAAALFASGIAIAQPLENYQNYQGYGPHMWWGGGWFGWILGPLMMIVFIGVIVAVVVLLIRGLGGTAQQPPGPSSRAALDILNERFARGEIDREEYEERRRVLGE